MTDYLPLRWLIYKKEKDNFPYWIFIEEEKNKFVFLKANDKWPGPGKNIFCKYIGEVTEGEIPQDEPIDSCEIFLIKRYGKKLNVVLNRSQKKRCWFIFLKKEYKKKPGEFYYQVFWITQSSAIASRRGAYIPQFKKLDNFKVIVDINERYPYRFGKIETEKKKLPIGDYGLFYRGNLVALAERKTKDNFLHEVSSFDVLKAKLQELSRYPHKAVIFESSYLDFVESRKNKFYSGTFIAELLAELFVKFP
ncbi:MAG: hypothetical protein NC898_04890, partial [Candidatus Omnitrophica bacterium]|nr:hypothetical protein [Candidatus Omnitrophota bacterium]